MTKPFEAMGREEFFRDVVSQRSAHAAPNIYNNKTKSNRSIVRVAASVASRCAWVLRLCIEVMGTAMD